MESDLYCGIGATRRVNQLLGKHEKNGPLNGHRSTLFIPTLGAFILKPFWKIAQSDTHDRGWMGFLFFKKGTHFADGPWMDAFRVCPRHQPFRLLGLRFWRRWFYLLHQSLLMFSTTCKLLSGKKSSIRNMYINKFHTCIFKFFWNLYFISRFLSPLHIFLKYLFLWIRHNSLYIHLKIAA